MRDFRKLEIWNASLLMVKRIYELTALLPSNEKYGLVSQMNRSAVSIPSNIAEGCSRKSKLEISRFLEIAIGSAFELETQIEVCKLVNYIEQTGCQKLIEDLNILQKQINAYNEMVKR